MPSDALPVLPSFPRPLQAAGFGFTLARITVRSSRTRFAGRLNSGVIRGQATSLRFASAGTAVVHFVGIGERRFGELTGNGRTLAPARGCFGT